MLSLLSDDNATRLLPIAGIRRDGGTQPRGGLNEATVQRYVDDLNAGAKFPPVDVVFDDKDYWLWDGFHRIEAHLRAQRTEILVIQRKGTLKDAQWNSFGANKDHGLPRTNEEKERAIRLALQHPNADGMTAVALARHLGVSDKTVTKYREQMQSVSEIPTLNTREGADGKQYPAKRPKPAPPTIYPISSDLAVAGWRVEAHSAGGYSPILTDAKGSMHLPRTWSVDDAVEQIRAHIKLVSAPAPAPAPEEEHPDIELMADAIRRMHRHDGAPAEQRKALLASNTQAYHEALLPHDRRNTIEPRIYQIARERVLHELLQATMTHAALSAPRPLNLDETIAVIWRLIKHNCAGDQRAETLHGIVTKHTKMTDYKHLLTSEVVFSFDTFSEAWTRVANELLGRIEHAKRTAQKAQSAQPTQPPVVVEDSDEAPPTSGPATLPADLVERGWVLREMAATGRWWCFNPNGPRATSPHDTIEQAAQAARLMQIDVAKPAAKPVATDEVTMALQRIEEAVGVLVERLGLDMLRVRLDERQGNPWSLLASKGDNELNWANDNLVGVSSALVNLGRKGAK